MRQVSGAEFPRSSKHPAIKIIVSAILKKKKNIKIPKYYEQNTSVLDKDRIRPCSCTSLLTSLTQTLALAPEKVYLPKHVAQLQNKKPQTPVFKMGKGFQQFSKENIQMAKKHEKKSFPSFVSREVQTKTSEIPLHTP